MKRHSMAFHYQESRRILGIGVPNVLAWFTTVVRGCRLAVRWMGKYWTVEGEKGSEGVSIAAGCVGGKPYRTDPKRRLGKGDDTSIRINEIGRAHV